MQPTIGLFLFTLILVSWTSIAAFFLFGVLPRIQRQLEPHIAFTLGRPLHDVFFSVGILMNLLGVIACVSMIMTTKQPETVVLQDPDTWGQIRVWQPFAWLGIAAFALLSSTYAKFVIVPAIRRGSKEVLGANDSTTRERGTRRLSRHSGTAWTIGLLQMVLAGIGLVAFFFVPPAEPEKTSQQRRQQEIVSKSRLGTVPMPEALVKRTPTPGPGPTNPEHAPPGDTVEPVASPAGE